MTAFTRIEVPLAYLPQACMAQRDQRGATLATMVGLDDRAESGTFRLAYLFRSPSGWVSVETEVDPVNPHFPSVTPFLPAAHWYEREVQDLLGLVPDGHPDPRRLVHHDDWPAGIFPLRKDFDPMTDLARVAGEKQPFHHFHGEGMVEIPVGPIHAGIIEPGHFRFAAVGELVLHLETRLFYTHRGIEKLTEGRTVQQGVQIAERICGACAMSHAVSYCQAIEDIAEAVVPPRAIALRTLFLELERLYNHIGDLGNVCAGTAFAVGSSQGARLKEELQRLNERLSGHRFLRGMCCIGGVRRDLDPGALADAEKTLMWVEDEFRRFADLLLTTDSFTERLAGTGVLPLQAAVDLGAVGVAARASGLAVDARRDTRYAGYRQLDVPVVVRTSGDVRARVDLRIDEATASFKLVRAILSNLPEGPLAVEVGAVPPLRVGVGVTESPRGENVHWVRTGRDGTIDRYRVRSASFCNWPVVALTVPGNMVPDFPLINKSFELCYSCLDR